MGAGEKEEVVVEEEGCLIIARMRRISALTATHINCGAHTIMVLLDAVRSSASPAARGGEGRVEACDGEVGGARRRRAQVRALVAGPGQER